MYICDQNAFKLLALACCCWHSTYECSSVLHTLCLLQSHTGVWAGPAAVILSTAAYNVLMPQICICQGVIVLLVLAWYAVASSLGVNALLMCTNCTAC